MHLKGRSALITGSGRGIGREIALLLSKEGANVVVNDPGVGRTGEITNENPADEVVATIRAAGGNAVAVYDSVGDYKKAGAMVDVCVKEFGSIDLLINCAGVLREKMIWNMSEEDFDLVINVHLKGTWNMSHHAIKHMRAKGFGRIVNFSSGAFRGGIGQCNYSAAKGGIISLTRSIAMEGARAGITANAVCPSADTRMTMNEAVRENWRRKLAAGLLTQEQYDRRTMPRGPEYVAPLVAYLCTDQAKSISGQILHIEKGLIHNYYFAEEMKKMSKESDNGMFSIDELATKIPEMLKDVKSVVAKESGD
jgi:NAD(P)-dependent dehydrogenase (short-subunit alcohol dehydrogenase family)